MPTGQIIVSSGIGVNVGTHTITEDALTKHLQRVALTTADGSVFGTTTVPIGVSIIGAITATLSGTPSISGQVGASIIGSVPVTFAASANQSVSGTVGASIIGTISAGTQYAENAVIASVTGTAVIFRSNVSTSTLSVVESTNPLPIRGSISGTVGSSVIGTVPVVQSGTVISSLVSTVPSSVLVGASIIGTVPVVQSGTVLTSVSGTVVVQSIVGTYAEDAAHTTGASGLFVLGVRNDAMPSITSANLDYSPIAVGPVGEVLTANAPLTRWVQGTASMLTGTPVNGGSVTVIAAQGSSIFTYITSGQVANASANNVYLTFYGATSSIVGYLPVPANSGALPILPNAWKTNANAAFAASVSGVASVFLSFQGFISET